MLEQSCWKREKTENFTVLNCGRLLFRSFLEDLKHGSPTVSKPHKPTHEQPNLPVPSLSLTVSFKRTLSNSLSPKAQQFTSAHFGSNNSTQMKKKYHPVTILWLWWLKRVWTCPIKLLDGVSGDFQVVVFDTETAEWTRTQSFRAEKTDHFL